MSHSTYIDESRQHTATHCNTLQHTCAQREQHLIIPQLHFFAIIDKIGMGYVCLRLNSSMWCLHGTYARILIVSDRYRASGATGSAIFAFYGTYKHWISCGGRGMLVAVA